MATNASLLPAPTSPLPTHLENKTLGSEPGDREYDVILADKLPYVIGGVTIACIIVVLVVALLLWKIARPCKQWHVRSGSFRECRAITLKEVQPNKTEASTMDIFRRHRKRKADPESTHPSQRGAPESHPSERHRPASDTSTAPDIITAHDSESVYELADEKQQSGAYARPGHHVTSGNTSHVTLGVRHVTKDDTQSLTSGGVADRHHVLVSAEVTACDKEGVSRGKTSLLPEPGRSSRNKHADVRDIGRPLHRPPPPPLPPKPHSAHRLVESDPAADLKLALERQSAGAEDTAGDLCVLPLEESLRTAMEKLSLQNFTQGSPLVCKLTVMGVMEKGRPVLLEQSGADCSAVFLLDQGRSGQSPEQRQPHASPRLQNKGRGERGQGGFAPQPARQPETLLRKEMEDSPHPHHGDAGRVITHYPGRRHSLQNNQADCPRDLPSRRFSESTCMMQSLKMPNIKSLPSLPSTQESLPSVCKADYARSFSSPQPSEKEARAPTEGPWASSRRLDAKSLRAKVQREMQALGLDDPSSLQEAQQGESPSTLSETAPSCGPSQSQYFILEPQSDGSEEDLSDCGRVVPSGPPSPGPRLLIKNAPTATPGAAVADLGEKHHYQPRPLTRGAPPRLAPRIRQAGHTRTRSETPVFQISSSGGGGGGGGGGEGRRRRRRRRSKDLSWCP